MTDEIISLWLMRMRQVNYRISLSMFHDWCHAWELESSRIQCAG